MVYMTANSKSMTEAQYKTKLRYSYIIEIKVKLCC